MHFGNPQALWLLAAWPLLVWLGWAALRWRDRTARQIGAHGLVSRLYPPSVRRWHRRRVLIALGAMALLMAAAARPQYGRVERSIQSYGTNVMLALDCSRSMLAQDVDPSRLESAKEALRLFLHDLAGNRVGVMSFAGDAIINCPMTLDRGMADLILQALDTDSVGAQGTDFARAIEVAAGAFERGAGQGGRALVLVTDGEDLEGGLDAAMKRAAEQGIVIYAIGLGTERGAPLRDRQGNFIEDPTSGVKVNSRLQMQTLETLAQATGGQAVAASSHPGAALRQIAAKINQLEKAKLESRSQTIYVDRFAWFLAPALLLLLWMLASRPEPAHPAQAADPALET